MSGVINPFYIDEGGVIREIGRSADRLERSAGWEIIRCHIGNPSTPMPHEFRQASLQEFQYKSPGYRDAKGAVDLREWAADILKPMLGVAYRPNSEICFTSAAANTIHSLAHILQKPASLLLSTPYYPGYAKIAQDEGLAAVYYHASAAESYIPSFEALKGALEKTNQAPALVILNFPHNPTGATLNLGDAKELASHINRLTHLFPNSLWLEDAVYFPITDPEHPCCFIHPHLEEHSLAQSLFTASFSKLGGAEDRVGLVASRHKDIIQAIGSSQEITTGGPSHALLASFLTSLAALDSDWRQQGKDNVGFRYALGEYYAERRAIITEQCNAIAEKLSLPPLAQNTHGGMFVWAQLKPVLEGKPIPKEFASLGETFSSGKQFTDMALQAHLIGYQPVSLAPGEVFGADPRDMAVRIGCALQSKVKLLQAGNSITGLIQHALEKNLGATPNLHKRAQAASRGV